MSTALPAKKPAWPAEKNLLYEFLGAAKNSSGQLKLRSRVEVDGLELKCKLTSPRESVEDGISEALIGFWGVAWPSNSCLIRGQVAVFPESHKMGKWLAFSLSPTENTIAREMPLAFRGHMVSG